MDNRKPSAPRYKVERVGDRYAIFDFVAVKYEIFDTRDAAERECSKLNGATAPKTSESPIHEQFRKKFRSTGITAEEIAAYYGEQTPDPVVRTAKARKLLENAKKWLPPMLRAWADAIAAQCGHDRDRRAWPTYQVIARIRKGDLDFRIARASVAGQIHEMIWPHPEEQPMPSDEIEPHTVLAVHYLATDGATIKGAYFGLSEREYYRQLGAAHLWLAREWVGERDLGALDTWLLDAEREAGELLGDDDDSDFHLDVYDRSNIREC